MKLHHGLKLLSMPENGLKTDNVCHAELVEVQYTNIKPAQLSGFFIWACLVKKKRDRAVLVTR